MTTRLDAVYNVVDYLTTLGAFVQTVPDPRLRMALFAAMVAIVEDLRYDVQRWIWESER